MTYICGILYLFGAFSIIDGSMIWSKTYSLKAVLNVPSADINEPYQVWVDGGTGNSRIDFYDGIDKVYKLKSDTGYNYYKIHPETTDNYENKEVCERLNADNPVLGMYEKNMYLPEKDFKYIGNDTLNGALLQKWVYDTESEVLWYGHHIKSHLTYTMWVNYKKNVGDDQPVLVPVRYEFRAKANDEELDYFRHDYSYFDDMLQNSEIFQIPREYECSITDVTEHEAFDPLMEYVDPIIEVDRLNKAFQSFKNNHNKTYSNENEHADRFRIFKNNLRYINAVNRQHRTFSLAVNHLVDRYDSELAVLFGVKYFEEFAEYDNYADVEVTEDDDNGNDTNILDKFDWRDYDAISSVKDQTSFCGSCYAFTVAATVESSSYVARGCEDLTELSEQALVDCTYNPKAKGFGNCGCKGGSFVYTLYWIRNHGIPYKSEYGPYLAMEGLCHNRKMRKFSKIQDYARLKKNKNVIKRDIRKYGPLVVGVNSKPKSFVFYSKGVYNDEKCSGHLTELTHAMALIGYGREAGQEYWILKNSYGINWGEGGYMKIAINSNICGTMNQVFKVSYKENLVEDCFKKNKFK